MAKNLNKLYDYRMKCRLKFTAEQVRELRGNPVLHHDDWNKPCFKQIKDTLRLSYYWAQMRRCAYCRKILNAKGYYEHLDHVIPKAIHQRWLFKTKNLVLACVMCNSLKNDEETLVLGKSTCRFPMYRDGFVIFNPHFERWGSHFKIVDGMFIVGRTPKGVDTIRICKLYKEHFSIRFAEESGVEGDSALKRATKRVRLFQRGSVEFNAAMEIINYYARMI